LWALAERAYVAAMSRSVGDYRPRDAEHAVLYRVIDEHLAAFLETTRRTACRCLPSWSKSSATS
jgi:hypothetical protein